MGYNRQVEGERVDRVQLAVDWFQLPDSVKRVIITAVIQYQIVMSLSTA